MEPAAAKFIGAGLAAIGMGGAAIGVGLIFGNFLSGALRNPRHPTHSSDAPSSARRLRKASASSPSSSRFFCYSFFNATCDAPVRSRAHRFPPRQSRRI